MDMTVKNNFELLWNKYFGGSELPICFYYTAETKGTKLLTVPTGQRCVIGDIAKARMGKDIAISGATIGCGGGRRYLGYATEIIPEFEYFLSYGIPGKLEGERYKKTPDLVHQALQSMAPFTAPARFMVFKRWDKLTESDNPEVVIFFARPDAISGLFTLANYDEAEANAVFSPFGAGCATIVYYPFLENESSRPRAVMGMFDVSARPCVPADVMTFAIPFGKFEKMVANIEESFLITNSWQKVKRRMEKKLDEA
jgi:uncharacterized protein (DUF169 family)